MTEIETAGVRVRGRSLLLAMLVALVLLLAALWAAKVDLDSKFDRNAVPLDVLATLYKVLIVAGLVVVGRRLHSRSINLVAVLVAVLTVGSLLVDVHWFDSLLDPVADLVADVFGVSTWAASLGIVFVALAVVAGWLVIAAFRQAAAHEKRTVLVLLGLLAAVGVFLGPVNAISSLGINREWLFAEDFGQVVTLAVLAAYTAGLVAASRGRVAQ